MGEPDSRGRTGTARGRRVAGAGPAGVGVYRRGGGRPPARRRRGGPDGGPRGGPARAPGAGPGGGAAGRRRRSHRRCPPSAAAVRAHRAGTGCARDHALVRWLRQQRARPAAGPGAARVGGVDGGVGVDVELVARAGDPALDPVLLAPGERVPTPEERTRLWTRKEAALKAGGVGLAVDPRSVGVRGDRARWPGGSARLLDVPAPGGARCSVAVLGGARPRLVVLDGEALLSRAGEAAREGRPSGGAARPGRCAGGSRRW